MISADDFILRMEKELMGGRGRFVADFIESFRQFKVRGVEFDAMIRGSTRVKGFFLSRVFSYLVSPNYQVACFILSVDPKRVFRKEDYGRYMAAIKKFMKREEIKWSWLYVAGQKPKPGLRRAVEGTTDRSTGVALVDLETREVFGSDSYLGRQAARYVRLPKG